MAATQYGVNDAEAVKLWSRKLSYEALKQTWASNFMGTDTNSLCYIRDDFRKGPGDSIRCILRMQLTGQGVQGDDILETNEETLLTFTDNLLIDQMRHAVISGGRMSEQRIPFSVREESRLGLQDWFADRIDTWFFNQLSGNTAETRTIKTGHQACITPSASTWIFGGSDVVATAESNLSANSSQIFSLALIDKAVLKAKTLSPVIRPVRSGRQDVNYVMFITPEMHYDMRRNTASMEWADIQKAVIQGGKMDSPIFTGALGLYNGVLLHEAFRLPRITTADGANKGGRAVLCGAQAAAVAFGRDGGPERFTWTEELQDYKNRLGVSGGLIGGLKKTVYNNRDFATITVSCAHSANAQSASGR